MYKFTITLWLLLGSICLSPLQAKEAKNQLKETAAFVNGSPKLLPNQSLKANQFLLSYNRKYKLIYQADGNLVVYLLKGSSMTPIWSTGTQNQTTGKVIMQGDGNLVVYNANNKPVWASHTRAPNRGAFAQMRNDGNFVIYWPSLKILWSNNSGRYNFYGGSVLYAGQALLKGQRVESNNRKYFLNFQSDGNLVLYRAAGTQVLWTARTQNKGAQAVVLQNSGKLCVIGGGYGVAAANKNSAGNDEQWLSENLNTLMNSGDAPAGQGGRSPGIWCSASAHPHHGSVRLQVENDGRVVIYSASKTIWIKP